MSWQQPTRKDHDTFCKTEQWQQVRNAQGRAGTHHVTYEFYLPEIEFFELVFYIR